MAKETNSSLDTFTDQKIFDSLLTIYSPNSTTKFAALWHSGTFTFKETYLTNSWRSFTKPWILISTPKHHIISIQYPSHKCLSETLCIDYLRILIQSWLFKGPVVIMKEIMSWLFNDPIVTVAWLHFDHVQWNSKKWSKGFPKWIFFSKNN